MQIRTLIFLLAAVLGAGCGAARAPACIGDEARAEPREQVAADPAGEAEAADDQRLEDRLRRQAEEMFEAKKTVPMATLVKQLDRRECRLTLAPAPAQRVTAAELYERARGSVLVMGRLYVCDKCKKRHVTTASGFVISESGACVTNYHVVNEATSLALVAMTADGRVLPVREVLAANKAEDVAILQLDGGGVRPLALGADPPVGSPVRVISHPDRRFYTLTEGIVSRRLTERRDGKDVPMMSITADFARGSSGAPVLDERGAVVGLATRTSSIYYDADKEGHKENLQMVIKNCVPARHVLALIKP